MDYNHVGNRIKAARKAKGLTQKGLARILGCSHTTISKYEKGEIENMPRPRIKQIADVLEMSPVILLGFPDDKQKQPVQDELSAIEDVLSKEEFALFGEVRDLTVEEKKKVLDFIKFTKSQRNE